MRLTFCALAAIAIAMPTMAADTAENAMVGKIIDAGMNHGEVMETAQYLTDRIGGRMTNSPQMRVAEKWTKQRFADYGLSNARLEPFEFGRGWSIDSSAVRMTSIRCRVSPGAAPACGSVAKSSNSSTNEHERPFLSRRDRARRDRRSRRQIQGEPEQIGR